MYIPSVLAKELQPVYELSDAELGEVHRELHELDADSYTVFSRDHKATVIVHYDDRVDLARPENQAKLDALLTKLAEKKAGFMMAFFWRATHMHQLTTALERAEAIGADCVASGFSKNQRVSVSSPEPFPTPSLPVRTCSALQADRDSQNITSKIPPRVSHQRTDARQYNLPDPYDPSTSWQVTVQVPGGLYSTSEHNALRSLIAYLNHFEANPISCFQLERWLEGKTSAYSFAHHYVSIGRGWEGGEQSIGL